MRFVAVLFHHEAPELVQNSEALLVSVAAGGLNVTRHDVAPVDALLRHLDECCAAVCSGISCSGL